MARHMFLGDIASWAFALGADETSVDSQSGKRALVIPSASITFWTAQTGGTQYTDLLDSVDTPITDVDADGIGEFPPIKGPDTDPETKAMWADGSGGAGPRRLVLATDLGDSIPDGLPGTIDSLTALTDLMPVIVRYDDVGASWPVRPAVAGARVVFWLGPTPPPIDGTHMLDNVDFFFDWLP